MNFLSKQLLCDLRGNAARMALPLVCFSLSLAAWAPAQPVEVVTPELRGAVQPQVAVAPKGGVFVAFGKGAAVYCATSTDGGQTFRPPVEVASLPKLALGLRRGPRIAATDTRVTLSAISHADGNLYAWTSDDAGATWSQGVIINTVTNAAREGLHGMAGDGRGKLYAVWLDLRSKGTQIRIAASSDGGHSWGSNELVYQSPAGTVCECCHPSVFVQPDGAVRVLWRNWLGGARDMYVARSRDGGKTFSLAEKLGLGTWPLKACPMDGGSLAGPYTVWRRESLVYYTDDRPGEHMLSYEGRQPVVSLGKEGPYFAWQQGAKLMVKRGIQGKSAILAETGAFPAIAAASQSQAPIVVWESNTNGVKTILATVLR